MLAAIHKHASMCELLVKKKASIDCVDQRGDSPLHKAAIGFDLPVIEALITKCELPPDAHACVAWP